MNACTRLWMLTCAALLAVALLAVPALAQEDGMDDADEALVEETAEEEDEGGRIVLADNPRDRLGLLLLTALVVGGGVAIANGRKQLKGRNPQASGEFRWR